MNGMQRLRRHDVARHDVTCLKVPPFMAGNSMYLTAMGSSIAGGQLQAYLFHRQSNNATHPRRRAERDLRIPRWGAWQLSDDPDSPSTTVLCQVSTEAEWS